MCVVTNGNSVLTQHCRSRHWHVIRPAILSDDELPNCQLPYPSILCKWDCFIPCSSSHFSIRLPAGWNLKNVTMSQENILHGLDSSMSFLWLLLLTCVGDTVGSELQNCSRRIPRNLAGPRKHTKILKDHVSICPGRAAPISKSQIFSACEVSLAKLAKKESSS